LPPGLSAARTASEVSSFFEHVYDERMSTARGLAVARLTSVCQGAILRYRRGATRADVLDELRVISTDPDVLAEAAAVFAVPHPASLANPDAESGPALLFDAGADRDAYERHCQARRDMWAAKPFDLAAFADLQNRWEQT